jgi:N-acetylglucosamine kinase-like BadF-type ATPase
MHDKDKYYLLALEGGGTRSQAALLGESGKVLVMRDSSDVNTNFVPFKLAQKAVLHAVQGVLESAAVSGEAVMSVASALVGARFEKETFGNLLPNAAYLTYGERDVIFARAGIYTPHGIGVVAGTGATAFGVRDDDGRQVFMGGWGSLLGDEGSAYALGLQGLRAATRLYEGRITTPSHLVEAICQHFALHESSFRQELVRLAYQKPLSRAEIASLAAVVARLARGDEVAVMTTGSW